MNERIKEFAKKCGWLFNGDETGNLQPDPEKFAELIVQECNSVMEEAILDELENSTYLDPVFIKREIINHFGIKE